MNTPTTMANATTALLAGFLILVSTTSGADSKILPGASCLPPDNVKKFARTIHGGYRTKSIVRCTILRDKTNSNRIRTISITFRTKFRSTARPFCTFSSARPNGLLVSTKSKFFSPKFIAVGPSSRLGGGSITLSVKNLKTVKKGPVTVTCNTKGHILASVFWDE